VQEFNEHLLDVFDRERALQREEKRGRLGLSASAGAGAGGVGKEKEGGAKARGPCTLFSLLVQANEQEAEAEAEGEASGEEGASARAVAARGRRLDMGELLGNSFVFLLAGPSRECVGVSVCVSVCSESRCTQRATSAKNHRAL
jgi:hypothetical protein